MPKRQGKQESIALIVDKACEQTVKAIDEAAKEVADWIDASARNCI